MYRRTFLVSAVAAFCTPPTFLHPFHDAPRDPKWAPPGGLDYINSVLKRSRRFIHKDFHVTPFRAVKTEPGLYAAYLHYRYLDGQWAMVGIYVEDEEFLDTPLELYARLSIRICDANEGLAWLVGIDLEGPHENPIHNQARGFTRGE